MQNIRLGPFTLLALIAITQPTASADGVQKEDDGPSLLNRGRTGKAPWRDWHCGIVALSVVFVLYFGIQALQLFWPPVDPQSPNSQRFFMAYRALHLESGVSPILPLLGLLLAYFGWGPSSAPESGFKTLMAAAGSPEPVRCRR